MAGIVERAKSALGEEDYATLKTAIDTLAFLTEELAAKGTSIERLRKLIFGASTEKTNRVVGADDGGAGTSSSDAKEKAPGHGRNGAAAYTGANKIKVPHAALHQGNACPECEKGKIYPLAEPATLVRVTGMAPLGATLYECERLRCNLCGEVFTAAAPRGRRRGEVRRDGSEHGRPAQVRRGLPFNRIEKLQAGLRHSAAGGDAVGDRRARGKASSSPRTTSWSARRRRARCCTTTTRR